MWINEFWDLDWDEELSSWSEQVRETAKEDSSSWGSKKRDKTQKDEKKAKRMDFLLAWFLRDILQHKEYDFLWDDVIVILWKWIPSSFLLAVLSLVYMPISDKIREISWKEKITFSFDPFDEKKIFNDKDLDERIKSRLNDYFEDVWDILVIEQSELLTKRLLWSIDDYELTEFLSKIFSYFLSNLNIEIDSKKSLSYSSFILSEIKKKLSKIKLEDF